MTVGELKELLAEAPDESIQVLIPSTMEFTGVFYSPCSIDSGMTTVGTGMELTEEDVKEAHLLGKELPEEPAFMLVPCGFGDEKDHTHEMN